MSELPSHINFKNNIKKYDIPDDDRRCGGFNGFDSFENLPRDEAALLSYGLVDRFGHRLSEKPIPMKELQNRGIQLPGKIVEGEEVLKALGTTAIKSDDLWTDKVHTARDRSPSLNSAAERSFKGIFKTDNRKPGEQKATLRVKVQNNGHHRTYALNSAKGCVYFESTDHSSYLICVRK